MKYEKLSNYEKHEINPFTEKAIEEVKPAKRYKMASGSDRKAILQAVNPDTGEVVGHTTFIRQIEVDEAQFTKLYLSQFEAFFDLNKQALKVFGYIINSIKPKRDEFYFSMNKCLEYTGYKQRNAVNSGIAQLIKSEIIARSVEPNWYFINPLVFFNGDSISYMKTYVKKKYNDNDTKAINGYDEFNQ